MANRTAGRSRRANRQGLTRGEVARTAVQVGDREGLAAATFRRLAAELGVTPMAVHHHVSDRDGLHTEMLAAILDDFDVLAGVDPRLPWTERLRAALLSLHAFNRRHPVLAELLLSDAPRSPAVFRTTERLIGLLLEAGFPAAMAVEAARVVLHQQDGLLLMEAGSAREASTSDAAARQAELRLLELPADEFPSVVAFAQRLSRVDIDHFRDVATEITVGGLTALLAGLQRVSPERP
jgi:TetR/AcrR family transcriptional regulator, tetracycline repressor protein